MEPILSLLKGQVRFYTHTVNPCFQIIYEEIQWLRLKLRRAPLFPTTFVNYCTVAPTTENECSKTCCKSYSLQQYFCQHFSEHH